MKYNSIYKLKWSLIAVSITVLVFFLSSTIDSLIQLHNVLGQATSTNISDLLNNGINLATEGNYNAAISNYDKVLAIDPNNLKALYNKGKALSQLGNYVPSLNNAAISNYDKILAIDPNNTGALYNKGIALAKLGNYNAAISNYDKILAIDPNNTGALYNKGKALVKLGNYNAAISNYDKILGINSTDTKALKAKADITAKLGKQKGPVFPGIPSMPSNSIK